MRDGSYYLECNNDVRVALDGNLPSGAVQEGLMPIYYKVIAWDGNDLFNHLIARKYFTIGQLR